MSGLVAWVLLVSVDCISLTSENIICCIHFRYLLFFFFFHDFLFSFALSVSSWTSLESRQLWSPPRHRMGQCTLVYSIHPSTGCICPLNGSRGCDCWMVSRTYVIVFQHILRHHGRTSIACSHPCIGQGASVSQRVQK